MRRSLTLPVFLIALTAVVGPGVPLPAQEPEPPEKEEALDKLTPVLDVDGHTAAILRVRFTPDGKQLVTGSADGTLRVWDVATGLPRQVLRVPGLGGGSRFALSPDGRLAAVAASYTAKGKSPVRLVYLLDLADGSVVKALPGPIESVWSVAFSPDGKRLAAVTGDKLARVYDVATGKEEFTLPLPRLLAAKGETEGVAFSPDGQRLACARAYNGGMAVFDLASRKEVGQVAATKATSIRSVAWLADDTLLTLGQEGAGLWSADGKARPETLDFDKNGAAVAVGKDVLLFAWNDNPHHRVTVLDRATGKERLVFRPKKTEGTQQPANVHDVALAPDGKLAASCGGKGGIHEVLLWDVATGNLVRRLAAPRWLNPNQSAFWRTDGRAVGWLGPNLPNGKTFDLAELALGGATEAKDRIAAVLSLDDGRALKQLNYNSVNIQKVGEPDVKLARTAHTIYGKTFAGPDKVALAEDYGGFFLIDAKTGKRLHTFDGRLGWVYSLAPHPDRGRYLVSLSVDQVLRVWDRDRDRALLSLYVRGEDWVVWTEEGYYACSPGGERFLGWMQDNGKDAAPTYHPAERFRSQLHRPDVLKLVLKEGSVAKALQAANAARKMANLPVPAGEERLDRLLPPVATLTKVEQDGPKVKLSLEARAGCPEQPVKSLRLLLDGNPFPGVARFVYPDGKLPATATEEVTVELPPGRHRLSVLARAKDDAPSASNPVEVVSPVPVVQRPMVRHVAVGVASYANKALDLKSAAGDAKALADALAASASRGQAYQAAPATLLTDQAATSKAVLAAIGDAKGKANAGDLFVLSFAGHGVRDAAGEFYLLTHEADKAALATTAVSGAALRDALADFPCQVLLLLDACQSGAFVPGKLGDFKPATDEAVRAMTAVETRAAVLCAAQGHEEAFEAAGGGLFTRAVVKALGRGPGVFFDPETGEMNVLHLGTYVYQEVTREAARLNRSQTPYLKLPLAQPAFVVAQFAK